jgi:hypothetical protein
MATPRSLPILALVALAAPACTDNNDVILIDPVQQSVDIGEARGVALADNAFIELKGADYNIVIGKTASILAAINDGQRNQADFALQVVIAADIADFAAILFDDHDISQANLDQVVAVFGVGYIPSTTESDVVTDYALGLDDLHATPPADIDFVYTDLQVQNHAASIVLLDELRDMVGNDAMGFFIDDMRAMEDFHLNQAEDLLTTFF